MPRTPITDDAHLRAILGEPSARVRAKDRDRLLPEHVRWLSHAPFCVIGTSGPDGTCDVSPKGDPTGSFHVVDEHTLAIPERPGNRRADGFANILTNPHVGLLFLIPGRGDTLRVNGRATLLADAEYADALVVEGHRPLVICEVAVEQVFFHCSKAFLRSGLWEPETWDPEAADSRAVIAQALERPDETLAEVEAYYSDASYGQNLY